MANNESTNNNNSNNNEELARLRAVQKTTAKLLVENRNQPNTYNPNKNIKNKTDEK